MCEVNTAEPEGLSLISGTEGQKERNICQVVF